MTPALLHLPLVRSIAARLVRRLPSQVDMRDLVQAGMLRLLSLTSGRPGWQHDVAFVSRHARGAMLQSLRDEDPLQRADRAELRRLAAANAVICARTGYATAGDLAAATGLALDEVHRLMALDAASGVGPAIEDMPDAPSLADDALLQPDQVLERRQSAALLAAAVQRLPLRQRQVVQAQLQGERVRDTAQRLHLRPATVEYWRVQALKALRRRLGAHPGV